MKSERKQKPTRRGGGSKLARSEVITVRLDPKLRFAGELAAAKDRRTLSSLVEVAVEQVVRQATVARDHKTGDPLSAWDVVERCWDVEPADRLAKLAMAHPELLTLEEQRVWKRAQQIPDFWIGDPDKRKFNYPDFRRRWNLVQALAGGKIGETEYRKQVALMSKGGSDGDDVQ